MHFPNRDKFDFSGVFDTAKIGFHDKK